MSKKTSWVLELHTPEINKPLHLTLEKELILGRSGSTSDDKVDVDLSPYDAAAKGVSRQHLLIAVDNDQLKVTDLNTPNGSTLNNKRLNPNQAYHLANDDMLILGTLKLTVKIVAAPSYENVPRKQTGIERKHDGVPGKGELVLIVEDHLEVAQLFSMMLQRQGFVTQISRDANRALHFLESKRPDAIILDLMLPGLDGMEICRYIRRDTTLDHTPIVIVSAKRDDEIELQAKNLGADMYMTKPINAAELGDVVAELIHQRKRTTGKLSDVERVQKNVTKALSGTATARSMSPPIRNDTVAVIVAGYTDSPFTISLRKPMTFGRSTNGNSATHVDLSRFNAADYGVSRVHLIMSHDAGKFFVEDAGSLNGTYINGQLIPPQQKTELLSGQEIRLGQLSMYIYFLIDTLV